MLHAREKVLLTTEQPSKQFSYRPIQIKLQRLGSRFRQVFKVRPYSVYLRSSLRTYCSAFGPCEYHSKAYSPRGRCRSVACIVTVLSATKPQKCFRIESPISSICTSRIFVLVPLNLIAIVGFLCLCALLMNMLWIFAFRPPISYV